MSDPVARSLPGVFGTLLLTAGLAACDGPATPSILLPPGQADTGSLAGTLVRYTDSTPIASATLIGGGRIGSTDAQGRFSLTGLPTTGVAAVTVDLPGFLFRSVPFTLSGARTGLTIDLLQEALPFSLPYYRALARNGYESSQLQALNPWTVNPSFYVNMQVAGASGLRMTEAVVDEMQRVITASIPELTGGRRRVAAFERGDVVRERVAGWVNITFFEQGDVFGRSSVGGNSGTIELRSFQLSGSNPNTNPNSCFSPEVQVLDHEITHTMGFWHTPDTLGDSLTGLGCPGSGRPEHVRYHAAVMYSRPPGNRDPDVDPSEAARSTAPTSALPPMVSCPVTLFTRASR